MRHPAQSFAASVLLTWIAHAGTVAPAIVFAQQPKQASVPKPVQDRTAELAAVQQDLKNVKGQLAALEKRLQTLQTRAFRLGIDVSELQSRNTSVSLDPATPNKFLRLDSPSGFFIVSLQEVVPYLDGFRVKLDVGNLTSARYVGFKLNATWGPRFDFDKYTKYTEESYKKWESEKQTREFSYTESLLPAIWNRVDLILPKTAATQIGFLDVSIDTDIVSLSR